MTSVSSAASRAPALRARASRVLAALVGAMAVAVAAQVAIPLPGTPVPMTLQPLVVLLVGGLLGPRLGAASIALYLALGAAGMPVFAPLGPPGLLRLFGPTGGYLLAFPFAAALVGWVAARRDGWSALILGPALGILAIHAGGAAQLLVLTGDAGRAFATGVLPFVGPDLLKVAVAAVVLRRAMPLTRALR